MNMRIPLKGVSVILSAVLTYSGFNGISTAETTLENADLSTAGVSTANVSDEECAVTDWWKAEITDYDSSLSLISYEMTPEATQTENEETQAQDNALLNGENNTLNGNNKNVSPTFVASPDTVATSPVEAPPAQERNPVNAESGEFVFTTYGWGHGVGLSQNGANFYAMYSGWSNLDILFHYYPGTYLMNTGTADSEQVTVNGVSGDVLSSVAGIVYREVGGSMDVEAIKAQAVAVYTYMKYYGNDSHDLRVKENPPQNVIDACASVLGEALYFDGDFALTMFGASSGGATANCCDVFSSDIPYLRSVSSDYDAAYDPHYGTVKNISSTEVKRLIEARYGITLSDDPLNWFQVMAGDGGYIHSVLLDGQITVRGNDLTICLGLKSPKFDIAYVQ